MKLQEEKKGAVTVIKPIGPLVNAEVADFTNNMNRIRSTCMGRFVLDASAIAYIDSSGLETLLDINDQLVQAGQSFKICGLNETVREVLSLTDLNAVFESYEDVGSAVRSFL